MASWLHKCLSGVLLLYLAALVTAVTFLLPLAVVAEPPPYGQDPFEFAIAGLMVLVIWFVLLMVVLFSQEPGPTSDSKGELERLIQLKQAGRLLQRSQRVREMAAKTSHHRSSTQSPEPSLAPRLEANVSVKNPTLIAVPTELVPEIQALIARRGGT